MTTPTHASAPAALPPAWRQRALLVPVLVAVSIGLLVARLAFDGDTFQNCRYLGPSTRMYVTSWAGVLCTAAALSLQLALSRSALRGGSRTGAVWQGRVAVVASCVALLVLLAQLATLYWLYSSDPSGGQDCSGLFLLHTSPW